MKLVHKKLVIYFLLPLSVLAVAVYWYVPTPKSQLTVAFFNVGQGDSEFIETASGIQVLMDGGPKSVVRNLNQVMPFYDRTLDLVVLSHPHSDHINGLIEVLKRYRVKKVLLPQVTFDSSDYREFLRIISEKHIATSYAYEGERVYLDNSTVLDIYYPSKGEYHATAKGNALTFDDINPNDTSIVAKLSYGKTSFLFTGDVSAKVEKFLLPKYDLDADVLKVAHQGSKTSTSAEFLAEVTPKYAVISVGKNSYGHPTKEVLDRLSAAKSRIFRTDDDGMISFTSDGSSVVFDE